MQSRRSSFAVRFSYSPSFVSCVAYFRSSGIFHILRLRRSSFQWLFFSTHSSTCTYLTDSSLLLLMCFQYSLLCSRFHASCATIVCQFKRTHTHTRALFRLLFLEIKRMNVKERSRTSKVQRARATDSGITTHRFCSLSLSEIKPTGDVSLSIVVRRRCEPGDENVPDTDSFRGGEATLEILLARRTSRILATAR
jgi:hypothetical protein